MKRISTVLMMLWLIFFFTSESYAQRNKIMYRPFEWYMIEDTSQKYVIYFPEGAEHAATIANEEIPKIIKFYSEKIFKSEWPVFKERAIDKSLEALSLGVISGRPIKTDSLGKKIIENKNYRPNQLVVVLYPNPQDYNQQMIIQGFFIPPGVLGFTETVNQRIACPYQGNEHEFKYVLAHEIAHAFMGSYLYDREKANSALGHIPIKNLEIPLWFIEGFAEFSATTYMGSESNNYRKASLNFFNLEATLNNWIPLTYNSFAQMNDFGAYAMGEEFMQYFWKGKENKLATFFDNLLSAYDFKEAWQFTLGQNIDLIYREWYFHFIKKYYSISLFALSDSAANETSFPLPIFLGDSQKKLIFGGGMSYDTQSGNIIGYEPNEKWGIQVSAIVNNKVVPITNQFKNKSLFLRIESAPAIAGRTVALAVNYEGQDKIQIYDIVGDENPKAKLREEIKLPENVLWANDLQFAGPSFLFFVGINNIGQKDIYIADFNYKRIIWKLTDNIYAEKNPYALNNYVIYIRNDSTHHEKVCYTDTAGKSYELNIGDDIFPNQIVVKKNTVFIRALRLNGVPEIIVWQFGSKICHRYRYGSKVIIDSTSSHTSAPIAEQLVGVTEDGRIVILNSEENFYLQDRLFTISLNTNNLQTLKVETREIKTKEPALSDTNLYKIAKKADKKKKYFSQAEGNIPFSNREIIFTDATGEHGSSGNILISKNSYWGWNGYGEIRYYDFSQRLVKIYELSGGAYYSIRTPFWYTTNGVSRDKKIMAGYGVKWPFDLENSINASVGLGFLKRDYVFIANRKNFQTPLINTAIKIASDATFPDFIRSSRHGHYFTASIYQTTGFVDKAVNIIDGACILDLRYYFRPWQASPYLALKIYGAKTFGLDPYAFFTPEFAIKPGFLQYNISESVGNTVALYQTELRVPLFRVVVFQYKFWETQYPVIILSLIPTAFVYGGGTNLDNEPLRIRHRFGISMQVGLGVFVIPFYVRIERYAYIDKWRTWQTATTIGLEY